MCVDLSQNLGKQGDASAQRGAAWPLHEDDKNEESENSKRGVYGEKVAFQNYRLNLTTIKESRTQRGLAYPNEPQEASIDRVVSQADSRNGREGDEGGEEEKKIRRMCAPLILCTERNDDLLLPRPPSQILHDDTLQQLRSERGRYRTCV